MRPHPGGGSRGGTVMSPEVMTSCTLSFSGFFPSETTLVITSRFVMIPFGSPGAVGVTTMLEIPFSCIRCSASATDLLASMLTTGLFMMLVTVYMGPASPPDRALPR